MYVGAGRIGSGSALAPIDRVSFARPRAFSVSSAGRSKWCGACWPSKLDAGAAKRTAGPDNQRGLPTLAESGSPRLKLRRGTDCSPPPALRHRAIHLSAKTR